MYGLISHLQSIILPSLMFKPANVTHLWIEEDLVCTSVCQVFEFDRSFSCCKGIFGRVFSTLSHEISQYKMMAACAFINLKNFYLKTYQNTSG